MLHTGSTSVDRKNSVFDYDYLNSVINILLIVVFEFIEYGNIF